MLLGPALPSACTSNVETRHGTSLPLADSALQAIDSLMWRQPDTRCNAFWPVETQSLRIPTPPKGDSLETHAMRLYNEHYYQLLAAELLYKNDYDQTNCTELQQAVGYFDSLMALADTRGVSLRPNPCRDASHASATDAAPKAIAFLETRTHYIYCRREPTSKYGIPVLLYNLGIQYDVANQKDSAAFYYDEALANMPDFDNLHYRDLMTNKTIFAYYNTHYGSDSVIKSLKHLVALSADEEEKTTRLLTLGNILFEDKQYDSSRVYLD